jgi:hypothetical protein
MGEKMKQSEIDAYNAGVSAVADLAKRAAEDMRTKLRQKPTRYGFAIEALEGLVEGSRDLMLPDDPSHPQSQPAPRSGPPRAGGAVCVVDMVE